MQFSGLSAGNPAKWRKAARRMANALGSKEIKKSAHRGRLDVAGQRSMGTEKISNPS